MRTLVIYNSQTGFTRRYAEWIVEELKCDIMPFAEAKSAPWFTVRAASAMRK